MDQDFSMDSSVKKQQPREGPLTKTIERQTAKIPSTMFLGLAAGSVALSAILAMSEK
jgi:hypothetical protein